MSEASLEKFVLKKEFNIKEPQSEKRISSDDRPLFISYPNEYKDKAIQEFDRDHIEDIQNSYEALSQNIEILYKNNEYALCLVLIEQLLGSYPQDFSTSLIKAKILTSTLDTRSAVEILEGLRSKYDTHEINFLLAENYYFQQQDHLSLDHYFQAIETLAENPENAFQIYKNIGNIYVKSGHFDKAEEFYGWAEEVERNSDVLAVNFGTLMVQKNEYEQAREYFKRAITINPANDKAWTGLALMNREYGDFELSWANLKMAVELNIENQSAVELAVEWAKIDNKKEFIIDILRKSFLEKNHFKQGLLLLHLYVHFHEFKNALGLVNELIDKKPQDANLMKMKENIQLMYQGVQVSK
ncbi:MAG: tetratricopeptide repeat protein [Bdellovibrionales bacterium]|nr:tetratricopeptide repeat protein [Bdellovibrionales bacterium]